MYLWLANLPYCIGRCFGVYPLTEPSMMPFTKYF
jgi:hypothetical protein